MEKKLKSHLHFTKEEWREENNIFFNYVSFDIELIKYDVYTSLEYTAGYLK